MESVTIAFDLMKIELQTTVESLNAEGGKLFAGSRYAEARVLTDKGEALQAFCRRVEALAAEWQDTFSEAEDTHGEQEAETARKIMSASKSPKTRLIVTLPDGTTFAEPTAALTLARVVQHVGFDRVEAMNIKVNKSNLVTRHPHPTYSTTQIGDYFVHTHSSTDQKRRHLEFISDQIGMHMEIHVV